MDHRISLTSSPPCRAESPACATSRRSLGRVSCCAAPGLLPVLPAAPRAVTAAGRAWRGSLMTVTNDGRGGSGRDQRTGTSPILGRSSFALASTLNRVLAVNRMACRRSLRDRNRGRPTFGPFHLPGTEAKEVPVRRVQVRQGLLEYHGRYRTGPGPLRGRPWPRSAAPGRCAPPGPAPAHRTPQPPRLTGPRRRPRHRPERPAH